MAQLAAIPNFKIDYVVINAGVLRYPNVSLLSLLYRSLNWDPTDSAVSRGPRKCQCSNLPCNPVHVSHIESRSFDEFAFHLHTNTIGPIITAQKLLQTNIPIGTIVFMSSDSGSAANFLENEDGYCRELC